MKEYFKRVITSWPTWTGTLVEVATAVYGIGILMGLWELPAEMWGQITAAVSIILGGIYKLFTIGNNPKDKEKY